MSTIARHRDRSRILIVGSLPPPYRGVSVLTENIIKSSLNERFELILLDTTDRRGIYTVGQLDFKNVLLAIRHGLMFFYLLIARQPDILYIPIARNSLAFMRDCLFLLPSRLFGRKVIIHHHGSDLRQFYLKSSFFMKLLIRISLRKARRGIVLGLSLRHEFKGLLTEKQITVLPNGIEPLLPKTRQRFRSDGGIRVLFLSALMRGKGLMTMLRSIPLVLKGEGSVSFVLAGEPGHRDEMREAHEFIVTNKIENSVEIMGPVIGQEKAELMSKADVFAFPPVAPEGHPLVILEAMSIGLPIIATFNGSIPETVIDGVNGFLVQVDDSISLAEKILLLSRDQSLRNSMGQKSREIFMEKFTKEVWINNLTRIFEQVLYEP